MSEQLPDRFYARVWLHQASLLIFSFLGTGSLVMGVLFWTGSMKDANNKLRPEAGPPATIIGLLMLLVAMNSLFDLWRRRKPTIQCFKEGLECRVDKPSVLDQAWYLPRVLRGFLIAISMRGLRCENYWVEWKDFYSAQVDGQPMKYLLLLYGEWQTQSLQPVANCAVI